MAAGQTPQQMSDQASQQDLQQIAAQSVSQPNKLIVGGQVGNTPTNGAIAPTPVVNQAITEKNPPSVPLITPGSNPSVLSASDANAHQSNTQSQLSSQQDDLNRRQAALNSSDVGAEAQRAFAAAKAKIDQQEQPIKENMATTERSADLSQNAQNVKTGVAGTDYGAAIQNDLTQQHIQQQTQFNNQYQDLLSKAWNSSLSGAVGALASAQKEMKDISVTQQKAQTDNIAAQKSAIELQKLSTGEADTTVKRMIDTGYKPTATDFNNLDKMYNLNPGTSQTLHAAANASSVALQTADPATKQTMSFDAATKINEYLSKVPLGQRVTIGNNEYIGTSKADVKTGVEIDKTTGQGLAYEYNPVTHQTTVTPMGTVGFENDGNWAIEKDDSGALWRANADTGKMLPMTPGPAQKTNNAVFPEGKVGPALPGHEANAGQCGAACNAWYGRALLPDSFDGKKQVLSKYEVTDKSALQTHDTFLMQVGTTGHVGVIGDMFLDPKTGKEMFTATESNYVPPNQGLLSNSRVMAVDDPRIKMFSRVPTPNLPHSGSDSVVSNMASGASNPLVGNGQNQMSPEDYQSFKRANPGLEPNQEDLKYYQEAGAVPSGYGQFGGRKPTEDKSLTPTEIKAYGLDPSDPKNVGLTVSGVKDALIAQRAANGGVTPLTADQKSAAESLANYTADMKTITAGRSGNEREALLAEAKRINPSFDVKNYQTQQKFMNNYTSGAMSDSLTSIDKAVQHLQDLKQSSDIVTGKRVFGGYVPGLSAIGDIAAGITHTAGDLKAFNENGQAVADELTKVFRGTGGSEGDIKGWQANLSDTNTAEENQKVLQKGIDLMAGQIKGLFDKYQRAMGGAEPKDPIISPENVKAIKEMGFDTTKLERYSLGTPPDGEIWVKQGDEIGSIPKNEFDPKKYIKF